MNEDYREAAKQLMSHALKSGDGALLSAIKVLMDAIVPLEQGRQEERARILAKVRAKVNEIANDTNNPLGPWQIELHGLCDDLEKGGEG